MRNVILGSCFAVGCVLAAPAPAPALDGDFEAATVRIEVRLVDRLSSRSAVPGTLFRFNTTSSVMIAGRFYPAQTHGHGVIVEARRGGGRDAGTLVLAGRSLDASDGTSVEIGLEPTTLHAAIRASEVVFEPGTRFIVDAPPHAAQAPT